MSRLLESYGFEVVRAGPLNEQFIADLELIEHDVLLIDEDEDLPILAPSAVERLKQWRRPVLFNDSMTTRVSQQQGDPEFGRLLAEQIRALLTPDDT